MDENATDMISQTKDHPHGVATADLILDISMVILSLAIVFLNSVSMVAFLRSAEVRDQATSILLAFMSLADLLVAPGALFMLGERAPPHQRHIVCVACALIQCATLGSSYMTLILVALDRYVFIVKPLRYNSIITPTRCVGLVLLLWLMIIVWTWTWILGYVFISGVQVKECTGSIAILPPGLHVGSLFGIMLVVFSVNMVQYGRVCCIARDQQRKVNQQVITLSVHSQEVSSYILRPPSTRPSRHSHFSLQQPNTDTINLTLPGSVHHGINNDVDDRNCMMSLNTSGNSLDYTSAGKSASVDCDRNGLAVDTLTSTKANDVHHTVNIDKNQVSDERRREIPRINLSSVSAGPSTACHDTRRLAGDDARNITPKSMHHNTTNIDESLVSSNRTVESPDITHDSASTAASIADDRSPVSTARKELRFVRNMMTVMLTNLLLAVPYFSVSLTTDLDNDGWGRVSRKLVLLIVMTNSLVNPVIHTWANSKYRKHVKRLFALCYPRVMTQTDNNPRTDLH